MLMTFVDNAVDLVIAHDELTTFSADHHAPPSTANPKGLSSLRASGEIKLQEYPTTLELDRNVQKRLSFKSSSPDIVCVATTDNQVDNSIDQVDCSERLYKTQQESRADRLTDRRRSSLNRSLALTPLFNSSEYIPVYANRVMITNTISDDEKWQLLSRKRSDKLSDTGYQINDDDLSSEVDRSKSERNASNETVYALCRPHNKSQPLSVSRSANSLKSEFEGISKESTASIRAMYRSVDENAVPVTDSNSIVFPLQKSQTESCLPMVATLQSAASTNHTQQLYVQSVPLAEGANITCQQTINIQINDDGECYVEGVTN